MGASRVGRKPLKNKSVLSSSSSLRGQTSAKSQGSVRDSASVSIRNLHFGSNAESKSPEAENGYLKEPKNPPIGGKTKMMKSDQARYNSTKSITSIQHVKNLTSMSTSNCCKVLLTSAKSWGVNFFCRTGHRNKFWEVFLYVIYIVNVAYLGYILRGNEYDRFYSVALAKDLVISEEFHSKDSHVYKYFDDIAHVEELWQYLGGPFRSALVDSCAHDREDTVCDNQATLYFSNRLFPELEFMLWQVEAQKNNQGETVYPPFLHGVAASEGLDAHAGPCRTESVHMFNFVRGKLYEYGGFGGLNNVAFVC